MFGGEALAVSSWVSSQPKDGLSICTVSCEVLKASKFHDLICLFFFLMVEYVVY